MLFSDSDDEYREDEEEMQQPVQRMGSKQSVLSAEEEKLHRGSRRLSRPVNAPRVEWHGEGVEDLAAPLQDLLLRLPYARHEQLVTFYQTQVEDDYFRGVAKITA